MLPLVREVDATLAHVGYTTTVGNHIVIILCTTVDADAAVYTYRHGSLHAKANK